MMTLKNAIGSDIILSLHTVTQINISQKRSFCPTQLTSFEIVTSYKNHCLTFTLAISSFYTL